MVSASGGLLIGGGGLLLYEKCLNQFRKHPGLPRLYTAWGPNNGQDSVETAFMLGHSLPRFRSCPLPLPLFPFLNISARTKTLEYCLPLPLYLLEYFVTVAHAFFQSLLILVRNLSHSPRLRRPQIRMNVIDKAVGGIVMESIRAAPPDAIHRDQTRQHNLGEAGN